MVSTVTDHDGLFLVKKKIR